MAYDLYKIRILDLRDDEVIAKIYLHNFQSPDLPPKKNIGLQIATDSFHHMNEKLFRDSLNLSEAEIEYLLEKTDTTTLSEYDGYVHGEIDDYEQYIAIAEKEIIEIKIINWENWETIQDWIDEWEKGLRHDENPKTPAPSHDFWIKFANTRLLKHLKIGLEWTTPMFDRTEYL